MSEPQNLDDQAGLIWGIDIRLAALILLALFIRLWPLPSWPTSDSANYIAVAWNYITPDSGLPSTYAGPPHDPHLDVGPMVFTIRPGLTWALALPIWAFGFRPESFCIFPLALGLLEVVLAFKVGKAVGGRGTGLLAAAIITTLPWSVSESRYAKADQISAVLAYCGLYVAALSPLRYKHAALCSIAAGALLGWAWLVKETTAFIFLAAALAAVLSGNHKKRFKSYLLVSATLLTTLALECLGYQLGTSDPLYRFHAMTTNLVQSKANFFTAESAIYGWRNTTYTKALLNRLLISGPRSLLLAPASLGIVLLGATYGAWIITKRRLSSQSLFMRATTIYLLLLLAIYNFAPTGLAEYRPIPAVYNYFYPLVLPAVIMISMCLTRLPLGTALRPWALYGLISVLGAAAFISIARNIHLEQPNRDLDCLIERLKDRTCLMTDPRTCFELSQRITHTPKLSPKIIPWNSTSSASGVEFALVRPAAIEDLQFRYNFSSPDLSRLLRSADLVEDRPTLQLWMLSKPHN
jgi:4-amino-4-deoxy-L-arabinose transferase-like glycosyltransferase